ncbi:ParB/RepB/Spo0J family partition protein [Yinghuangia sp. ASG 101]|uniref:ParB/RepB/Spo0J family partition protein n=1 Tax=Yinghuangia sp. ASG 101 TaxID=2896848 RepID=UPI001E2FE48C|nr:ParB/RepB/Spo0J family partition protein [Yinghuangia sp. ASG 101]UGQ08875.1 ParB/RepB/Spo0J family partition protein [Yinghuangia sp. ASG 101]
MNERRRGLGRGLSSLIPPGEPVAAASALSSTVPEPKPSSTSWPVVIPDPAAPEDDIAGSEADSPGASDGPVDGAYFAELPVDAIARNPRQPREVFSEDAMRELAHSIREVGLLQPIVVRQTGPDAYELIMGERRLRASKEAGLTEIPAIVRATDDNKLLLDALLENLHRADLNAIEEAAAYDQLLRDFACTQEALADRIGRSRPQVTNTLRLLKLPPEVQAKIQAGTLAASHARALLGLKDPREQIDLAKRIIAEELTVRTVEEIVLLRKAEEQRNAPAKPKRSGLRAGKRVSPALSDLASRLKDRFETSVSVDLGQKKGKIVVEFASIEDLERILGVMAPGEGRLLATQLSPAPQSAEEPSAAH